MPLLQTLTTAWDHAVGVRYRSVAHLAKTWRTFSGRPRAHAASWAHTVRLLTVPHKTLLFYPQRPSPYAVLYKLCAMAGYRVTTDPEGDYDAVFRWHNTTKSELGPFENDHAAINHACTDISKQHVGRAFEAVFGYHLEVDPITYAGRVVKKSDANATHDGKIIECPISPYEVEEGFVYQKAIDNRRDDGDGYYEYRVPIFGDTIPVAYVKYRPLDAQFKEFDGAEVTRPDAVLTNGEQSQILALARALDLEYGEMDVLRDRTDGRIYVVDANNTPSGPERGFETSQSIEALQALMPAFEALLEDSADRLAQGSPTHRGARSGAGRV